MSRLFILTAILLLMAAQSLAQPGWQRVATLGGGDTAISNFNWANGLAAAVPGPNQTLYVAGVYAGDPVALMDSVPVFSEGGYEAFLACFGPDGRMRWVRTVNSPGYEEMLQLAVDPQGNATVLGSCSLGAQYDPSEPRTTFTGKFLASYDARGQLRWFQPFQTRAAPVLRMTADAQGNLIFMGYVTQTTYLDTLQITAPVTAGAALYVAKRRSNRTWAWAVTSTTSTSAAQFGTTDLATDPAGNIYATASFRERFVWGTDSVRGVPRGTRVWDQFVVGLDSVGALRWLHGYSCLRPDPTSSSTYSYPMDFRLAPPNNNAESFLLVGRVRGTLGYNTTAAQDTTYRVPRQVAPFTFLIKANAQTGRVRDIIPLVTSDSTSAWGMVENLCVQRGAFGGIYLGGTKDNYVTFGTNRLITIRGRTADGFLARFDTTGTAHWVGLVMGRSNSGPNTPFQNVAGMVEVPGGLVAAGTFMSYPTLFPPNIMRSPVQYHSLFVGRLEDNLTATPPALSGATILSLWPNPANGTAYVRLPKPASVQVLDGLGRLVRVWHLNAGTAALNLRELPPGLYLIRNGSTTRRLVIE